MTVPRPELPDWLALRRVHRGAVAKVGDAYVDRGRRIPDYLAAALDQLTGAGLVALGEPEPGGSRQVRLTPTGRVRLASLNERLEDLSASATRKAAPVYRWAVSPVDYRSHVLDDGVVITRCGQYLPRTVATDRTPGAAICPLCNAIVVGEPGGPPEFDSP